MNDAAETDSVLVMLMVPKHWKRLSEEEIARKLRANEPGLSRMLAAEVKRWAGKGAINLTGLRQLLEEREAIEKPGGGP